MNPQRPLRILFVNRMAAMERGGGETFDLEIGRALAQLGHAVTYLTGRPVLSAPALGLAAWWPPEQVREFSGRLRHVALRSPYLPWFPWDKLKGGWRVRVAEFKLFEWAAAAWIRRHADAYDIIQVCELPFLVSLLKKNPALKTPVVMRLTAPNAYDPAGGILAADALIASGTSIAKVRAELRPDCEDVPNAVDHLCFQPGPSLWRKQQGLAPAAPVLLYVARFQAFKNHPVLLQAFRRVLDQHPDAVLILVGAGPLKPQLESLAKEMGMDHAIRFLGEVPFAELPEVYRAADIKVISSDYESFCFAALEGMATGLPVVTTDCAWVPNLLGDVVAKRGQDGPPFEERNGGLVVPIKHAEALAAAVLDLLASPDRRAAMGAWNRNRVVERHGWLSSAERLQAVYARLADPRAGTGQ